MNAFSQAVKAYGANPGWQGLLRDVLEVSPPHPATAWRTS